MRGKSLLSIVLCLCLHLPLRRSVQDSRPRIQGVDGRSTCLHPFTRTLAVPQQSGVMSAYANEHLSVTFVIRGSWRPDEEFVCVFKAKTVPGLARGTERMSTVLPNCADVERRVLLKRVGKCRSPEYSGLWEVAVVRPGDLSTDWMDVFIHPEELGALPSPDILAAGSKSSLVSFDFRGSRVESRLLDPVNPADLLCLIDLKSEVPLGTLDHLFMRPLAVNETQSSPPVISSQYIYISNQLVLDLTPAIYDVSLTRLVLNNTKPGSLDSPASQFAVAATVLDDRMLCSVPFPFSLLKTVQAALKTPERTLVIPLREPWKSFAESDLQRRQTFSCASIDGPIPDHPVFLSATPKQKQLAEIGVVESFDQSDYAHRVLCENGPGSGRLAVHFAAARTGKSIERNDWVETRLLSHSGQSLMAPPHGLETLVPSGISAPMARGFVRIGIVGRGFMNTDDLACAANGQSTFDVEFVNHTMVICILDLLRIPQNDRRDSAAVLVDVNVRMRGQLAFHGLDLKLLGKWDDVDLPDSPTPPAPADLYPVEYSVANVTERVVLESDQYGGLSGPQGALHIAGDFQVFESYLWSSLCVFRGKTERDTVKVLEVVGRMSATEVECGIPGNLTVAGFQNRVEILMVRSDTGKRIYSLSPALEFGLRPLLVLYRVEPDWIIYGQKTELEISGRWFPDDFGLQCLFGGREKSPGVRVSEEKLRCELQGDKILTSPFLNVLYSDEILDLSFLPRLNFTQIFFPTVEFVVWGQAGSGGPVGFEGTWSVARGGDQAAAGIAISVDSGLRVALQMSQVVQTAIGQRSLRIRLEEVEMENVEISGVWMNFSIPALPAKRDFISSIVVDISDSRFTHTVDLLRNVHFVLSVPAVDLSAADVAVTRSNLTTSNYWPYIEVELDIIDYLPLPEDFEFDSLATDHSQEALFGEFPFRPDVDYVGYCWVEQAQAPVRAISINATAIVCPIESNTVDLASDWARVRVYVGAQDHIKDSVFYPGLLLSGAADNCRYYFEASRCVPFASHYKPLHEILYGLTEILKEFQFLTGAPSTVSLYNVSLSGEAELREGSLESSFDNGFREKRALMKSPERLLYTIYPVTDTDGPFVLYIPPDWFKNQFATAAVYPDWGVIDGGDPVTMGGYYQSPIPFNRTFAFVVASVDGNDVQFSSTETGVVVSGTYTSTDALLFGTPKVPRPGTYQFFLNAHFLGPQNTTNIVVTNPTSKFIYVPVIKMASQAVPAAGPAGGTTNVSFSIEVVHAGEGALSGLLDQFYDCAFASDKLSRVPAYIAHQPNQIGPHGGEIFGISCRAPMAPAERKVCVQLVPSEGHYLRYPTLQANGCDLDHSVEYTFYRQIPRVISLSPGQGSFQGGTTVNLKVVNMPDEDLISGVICRFDIFEFPGVLDFDKSTVSCISPTLKKDADTKVADPRISVEVALSLNGGYDFTEPVLFIYMPPFMISTIAPPFGPLQGNTPLVITVDTDDVQVMDYVKAICFNDVLVPVERVGLFQVQALTPVSPTLSVTSGLNPADFPLGYTVGLGVQQLDGRCFAKDAFFTFVQPWRAFAFYGTQTGAGGANSDGKRNIVLWGANFQRYSAARCRFRVHVPAGLALEYQDLREPACWIFGDATVHSDTRVTCLVDIEQGYWRMIDSGCNGTLLKQMQQVHPRQTMFLNALSLEVEVAINGVDFAVVVDDTDSEHTQPWVFSLFREPTVRETSRLALEGLDVGGYDVSLVIPSGSMFNIRTCRFQRYVDTATDPEWYLVTPARPETTRSVRCQVPRWHLRDSRASNETTRLSLGYEEDRWSNSTKFVFIRSPEVRSVWPLEGPHTGGTRVTISGEGFTRLANYDLKCAFGEIVVDVLRYNDTTLVCFSPFVAHEQSGANSGSGEFVVVELRANKIPIRGVGGKEVMFFYRRAAMQVTHVAPLSGPIDGGTVVSIWSERFIENSGLLGCIFGAVRVEAVFVNPMQITCLAPSSENVGPQEVPLRVSLDGEDTTGFDLLFWNNLVGQEEPVMFQYYYSPNGAGLSPGFGSSMGGTRVMIRGTHFRPSETLSCQFGMTVVKAEKFISENAILCVTPRLSQGAGRVTVRVSNNGRDFAKADEFIYINSEPVLLLAPFLGPASGGTTVVITIADPELLPANVWSANMATCFFGTSIVSAAPVDSNPASLKCSTPANPQPGLIDVFVSLNGQDKIATQQKFLFYEDPVIQSVSPSLAPRGERNYLTIRGRNFFNTQLLAVRFGFADAAISMNAVWLSNEEIRVLAPIAEPESLSGVVRLPLFASNNGQNFAPVLSTWSPDDEVDSLQYFSFHPAATLRRVIPEFGDLHGGGYVTVIGGPFLKGISTHIDCSFDWVFGVKSVSAVVLSSSALLCGVPNMWESHRAFNLTAQVRVTINGEQWSKDPLKFHFLYLSSAGHFTYHPVDEISSTIQNYTFMIQKCPAGHYCEERGLSFPSECPVGQYQNSEGRSQCLPCPRGFYCPRDGMFTPELCPAGWVCDVDGLAEPNYRCPGGLICLQGTAEGNIPDSFSSLTATEGFVPAPRMPIQSPRGLFALAGSETLRSSPGNLTTPQPCFQGQFCPPGSASPYGAGSCPLGRFCPSPVHTGILCPGRYACGPLPGQFEPQQCGPGTWNHAIGQQNCTLAFEGSLAPSPAVDVPMESECGFVALRKGVSVLSGNEMCPAGRVCERGVATVTEPGICAPTAATNTTSGRLACLASFGQVYVSNDFLKAHAPRVLQQLGQEVHACCWSYDKVDEFLSGVEEFFASFPTVKFTLEAGEVTRLRRLLSVANEELMMVIDSTGFDGSYLLGRFTETSLLEEWGIQIQAVRTKLMFEIERRWSFRGPSPCPKGSFCNAGTCADVPVIIIDSGQETSPSGGRRLTQSENLTELIEKRPYLINMPVYSPPRFLAEDEIDPLGDLRSLAALKAPQQCLAGTYCNERANSSTGTGLCPVGFFCGSGSEDPLEAPAGQFVGEPGRVRGRECTPGSFSPEPSQPFCLSCPPGYSCPSFGTQTPYLCVTGTFRASSGRISSVFDDFSLQNAEQSISCNECTDGTWSPQRGTADETSCYPCPAGRVCIQKTGNLTETRPCPEGFMCGEGTTLETASDHPCLNGFYCGQSTTPESVYSFLCNPGFFCQPGTTFANRFTFRCPVGFVCPSGTGYKLDMTRTLTPNVAYLRAGHFYILQVVGQYCLRQAQAVEYNQLKATNEALARAGLPPLLDQEVQERMSGWSSLIVSCVQDQIQYIPDLAINAEAVNGYLYATTTWHSEKLFEFLTKPAYAYTNKCINDTYPRFDADTSFQCLCELSPQHGDLMKCLTRAEAPFYTTPIGAPVLFIKDTALDESACSPYPDCIDWARLDNYNEVASQTSGPKGGPYVDDFDKLAVPFIEYVKRAIERETMAFLEAGESSLTSCPLGTMTQEDGADALDICQKRSVLQNLGDNVDMSIYRVNPVNRHISNSSPFLGKNKEWEEDLRLAYNISARSAVKITIDLRHLPDSLEYGRDWIIRIYSNSSMSPESNDAWFCEEAWLKFYSERKQADQVGITDNDLAMKRFDRLMERNCSMLNMPLGFESFMRSMGTVCPSVTDAVCYSLKLPRELDMQSCRGAQDISAVPADQKLVHEFYYHPLVDQLLRVEIVMVNGLYASDRFHFVRTVGLEVLRPSRAVLGTPSTYVIEYGSDLSSVVYPPFNMPVLPTANSPYETKYTADSKLADSQTPLTDGVSSLSQEYVLSRAFLGWLPTDPQSPLTNCMRHGDDYEEFMIYSGYWLGSKSTTWQTHLPYFSNCRGFGTVVPLWQLVEQSSACVHVDPESTAPIFTTSFGQAAFGDSCKVEVECMLDEVPNSKQSITRWFEAATGVTLFRISRQAFSNQEYAQISGPIQDSIPVVLRSGALADGSIPSLVSLKLWYWQKSLTEKLIIKADVSFDAFATPSNDQSKGDQPWLYKLQVSWEGMSHIDVLVSYAFPFSFYLLFFCCIGLLSIGVTALHLFFNRMTVSRGTINSRLLDSRYLKLVAPPMLRGFALACLPCLPGILVCTWLIQGQIAGVNVPLFSCDQAAVASDPLSKGCKYGLLDGYVTSFSNDSLNYQQRRDGRAAVTLLVIGCYMLLVGIKSIIPSIDSQFYKREENGEDEGDESGQVGQSDRDDDASSDQSGVEKEGAHIGQREDIAHIAHAGDNEEEEEDEQIFSPNLWKRSAYFTVVSVVVLLCTTILEFSYSATYTALFWVMPILFYVLQLLIEMSLSAILHESFLTVPINILYQVTVSISLLATPNLYSFVLISFEQLGLQMLDRIYVAPNQRIIAARLKQFATSLLTDIRWITSGKIAEGRNISQQHLLTGSEEVEGDGDSSEGDDGDVLLVSGVGGGDTGCATESMLWFLHSQAVDSMECLFVPICILVFLWVYNPTQTLNYYNVSVQQTIFYVTFYFTQFFFKSVADLIVMNSAEAFWSWKLLDYLDFCNYRYHCRPHRMKGESETFDETLAPGLRSLDAMCFSDQFYFKSFLTTFGAFLMLVGIQVAVNNAWNVFQDPASGLIVLIVSLVGRLCKAATMTTADYLKVWHVTASTVTETNKTIQDLTSAVNQGDEDIRPPASSVLYNWPEPSDQDEVGLERYREAFLKENQLWLQHSFEFMIDEVGMAQYRKTLLTALAGVLGEVEPDQYMPDTKAQIASVPGLRSGTVQSVTNLAPSGQSAGVSGAPQANTQAQFPSLGGGAPSAHFAFDTEPPHESAAVFANTQRQLFTGTDIQELVRLWLTRARFLLRLRAVSRAIRPDQSKLTNACELCKKMGLEAGLAATPIFTLTRLASEFRRQREMSPLWNMEMWRNFYQRFTPTCTVCTECAVKYWERNIDIPVDEPRLQRLRMSSKSAVQLLRESPFGVNVVVDKRENAFLKRWQTIAECLQKGEDWREFLPLLGYSADAELHEEALPDQHKRVVLSSDDDSETETKRHSVKKPVSISPVSARLAIRWVQLARRNVKHPNIRDLLFRKMTEEIAHERDMDRRRAQEEEERRLQEKRIIRKDNQGF